MGEAANLTIEAGVYPEYIPQPGNRKSKPGHRVEIGPIVRTDTSKVRAKQAATETLQHWMDNFMPTRCITYVKADGSKVHATLISRPPEATDDRNRVITVHEIIIGPGGTKLESFAGYPHSGAAERHARWSMVNNFVDFLSDADLQHGIDWLKDFGCEWEPLLRHAGFQRCYRWAERNLEDGADVHRYACEHDKEHMPKLEPTKVKAA